MVMLAYLTITCKVDIGVYAYIFLLIWTKCISLCKDFMFILISLINEISPDLVSGGGGV